MNTWRCLAVVVVVLVGGSAYPLTMNTPAFENTSRDSNSVVPYEFANNMEWSEQASWHWVRHSYAGDNTTAAAVIASPYFVATRVRSLSRQDQCQDCLDLGEDAQGPPLIFDGLFDPRLSPAYANLDNGPRYATGTDEHGVPLWTEGAWYLNYSPISDSFFAWTWIPDEPVAVALAAVVEPQETDVDLADTDQTLPFLSHESRVFPLAPGTYQLTQEYGCVRHNHGYPASSACPPDHPSYHNGVDWGAAEGTGVYASASGTVIFASIDPSNASGNSVIRIRHDGESAGYLTEYLHWINPYVQVGDYVHAGQLIAEVSSVGYSTGPHLHFSVREVVTGNTIDPLRWLQSSVAPQQVSIATDSALVRNVLRWEPLIRDSSKRHDVPGALIAAVITVESGGNPDAISPAGARGLMQVMPANLERFGVAPDRWLDPASNIDAGARYLAESLSSGQSIQQAAARYFGNGCDVLGTCTDQYIALVLSWYAYYSALFAGEPLPDVVVPAPVAPDETTAPSPPSWVPAVETPDQREESEVPAPPVELPDEPTPEPEATEAPVDTIEDGNGPADEIEEEQTEEPTPAQGSPEVPVEEPTPESNMIDKEPTPESSVIDEEPTPESSVINEEPVVEQPADEETIEPHAPDEWEEDSQEQPVEEQQHDLSVFGFGDVDARVEEPEFRTTEETSEQDTPDNEDTLGAKRYQIRSLAKPRPYPVRQLL